MRQIERLQLQMKDIRNNMRLNGRKFEKQRRLLEHEKSSVQEDVTKKREEMRAFQAEQRFRRGDLAQRSDLAITALQKKLDLAQRIITLGELTRRKETEREKIQPFYILKEETDAMEQQIRESDEVDEAQFVEAKHPLSNFHRKFNTALSEKLVVERERDRLKQENDQLVVKDLHRHLSPASFLNLNSHVLVPTLLISVARCSLESASSVFSGFTTANPGWTCSQRFSAQRSEPAVRRKWPPLLSSTTI